MSYFLKGQQHMLACLLPQMAIYFIFSLLKIPLCSLFLGLLLHPMWKTRNKMKIFHCKMQYWVFPAFFVITYLCTIVQGQGGGKLTRGSGSSAMVVLMIVFVYLLLLVLHGSEGVLRQGHMLAFSQF